MKQRFKINADMIVGSICAAIGAFFYFTQIDKLPARSQVFPRIAFLLFIFLSVLVVIQGILTSIREEKSENNEDAKKASKAKKADEIRSTLVVTLIIAAFIAIMWSMLVETNSKPNIVSAGIDSMCNATHVVK